MNTEQPTIYQHRASHVTVVSYASALDRDSLEALREALVGNMSTGTPVMISVTRAVNLEEHHSIPDNVYETCTLIPYETAFPSLEARKILPIYVKRTNTGFVVFEYQPLVPVTHEPPIHTD